MQSSRLDKGEASLVAVAEPTSGSTVDLVIDIGYAFNNLQEKGMASVMCLAQALHLMEEAGHLPS